MPYYEDYGPLSGHSFITRLPVHFKSGLVVEGAISGATGRSATKVISNNKGGGDYIVDPLVDVSSAVAQAISDLTQDRTSVETVLLRGNFTVAAHIAVPSYTQVILDGTMTTTTLRSQGSTNWTNNMNY